MLRRSTQEAFAKADSDWSLAIIVFWNLYRLNFSGFPDYWKTLVLRL